jgi:hypothetical protein
MDELSRSQQGHNLEVNRMNKVNPKLSLERITTVKRVWGTLRPNSSFYGMTLAQFSEKVQASLDARAELETIDEHRSATAVRRDDADAASMDLIKRIVNAIKADPNEGEDGEMYAALGYVRKGLRASGRSRNRAVARETPSQPSAATSAKAKEGATATEAA